MTNTKQVPQPQHDRRKRKKSAHASNEGMNGAASHVDPDFAEELHRRIVKHTIEQIFTPPAHRRRVNGEE